MKASDLILELKQEEIDLQVVNGQLEIKAPKGKLSSQKISKIKQFKDDLVALINKANAHTSYSKIEAIEPSEYYEVSHGQRRLWIMNHFERNQVAYNISSCYRLEGVLNISAFERTFENLIERHEILRTTFHMIDGDLKQKVHADALGFTINYMDVRNKALTDEVLQQRIAADSRRGFDLDQGPLVRASLYHTSDDGYVFLLVMHHIISDAWSSPVMVKEILHLYNTYCKEQTPSLRPLVIQYKDYAYWQHQQLHGESLNRHQSYWLTALAGELPVLNLSTVRPRPAVKTFNGASISFRLNSKVVSQVKEISRRYGLTIFMFIVASVKALLHRYTGQDDIIVGTTIAGREHDDLEDQIGFYVNTLALRTRFTGESSFLNLLENVREVTVGAFSHQLYPFDRLVDHLSLDRDMSRSPLFDVLVELVTQEDVSASESELEGLRVTGYPLAQGISQYDLSFKVRQNSDGVVVHLEYNSDLFNESYVRRLQQHYCALMEHALQDVTCPISRLSYLSSSEEMLLLHEFNTTQHSLDVSSINLWSLFCDQAGKTPQSVALIYNERKITYDELLGWSRNLGHHLQTSRGVKNGDIIGILMNRSEHLVIALLGILSAGGAFLCVDKNYPSERKRFMLQDSSVKLVITDSTSMLDLPGYYQGEMIALDVELSGMEGESIENNTSPDDVAYILYTSGSTGLPKGVVISHGSIVNYVLWANAYYFSNSCGHTFGLFTSLSFDLTLTSLLTTLVRGDILYIYEEKEISEILEDVFCGGRGINTVKLTPTHINLLKYLPVQSTTVSLAIVGGEKLNHEEVQLLTRLNKEMRVYNEYGPTETTIGSTIRDVTGEATIDIGRPIWNTQVYVLDWQMQLQGIGVEGDLYIGGSGLSHGYLNRAELTSEKFVTGPRLLGGTRLYRTGDIGKWNEDGNLEYKGRKDSQVKIKGYRIELSEIESVLKNYKRIEDAVVSVQLDKEGCPYLVAYLVGPTNSIDGVSNYLQQYLPSYMIPGHYMSLAALPVTSNGKLDRSSLPIPNDVLPAGQSYVAPTTSSEMEMVGIWENVLNKTPIGVQDNFFVIGGDSIKAIRVVSFYNERTGAALEVKDLFRHQDISALSRYLKEGGDLAPDSAKLEDLRTDEALELLKASALSACSLAGMKVDEYEDIFPMSDIIKGMIFHNLLHGRYGVYHDQFYHQIEDADFDFPLFSEAFSLLVDKHEILRSSFHVSAYQEPIHIVHKGLSKPDIKYEDLRGQSSASQQEFLETYLKSDRRIPSILQYQACGDSAFFA